MEGVNAIHLCVYVSGSAISSANLATAEDDLFNLDRRGGTLLRLRTLYRVQELPNQNANARAVDEPPYFDASYSEILRGFGTG